MFAVFFLLVVELETDVLEEVVFLTEDLGRGKGSGIVVWGDVEDFVGCFLVNSGLVGARGTGFCKIGATGLGTSGRGATLGSTLGAIATG